MTWIPGIALLTFAIHFPAYGQTCWSGSGPVTTTCNVGIGTASPTAALSVAGGQSGVVNVTPGWFYGTGTWIDLDTSGPSGVGTGGPGTNPFVAYSSIATQWFYNSVVGDVNYRNANGKKINIGIDNGYGTALPTMTFSGTNVGIGTNAPTNLLTVNGDGPNALFVVGYSTSSTGMSISNTAPGGHSFNLLSSGGVAAPAGSFGLFDSTAGSLRMVVAPGGNVGIGLTTPQYPLSVKGVIGAGEVVVTNTSGWADYVFSPDYRLRPLAEVASYIRANHHLPEIPSADEVGAKGVGVGEMQSRLLAKVEELTLHMIQAEEKSKALEEENRALRELSRETRNRLESLEKAASRR